MTYDEAVLLEGERREIAFLPLTISICGVECVQLTLERLLVLYAAGSPFVCGGGQDEASALQCLWIISEHYPASPADRAAFIDLAAEIPAAPLRAELCEYFDAALMDRPDGGSGASYVSMGASYVHAMGKEYSWSRAETMACPVAVLFQLIRCMKRDSYDPHSIDRRQLTNRLSDSLRDAPLHAEAARIAAEFKAKEALPKTE